MKRRLDFVELHAFIDSIIQTPKGKSSRRCKCCGAPLSIYNPGKLCRPCDEAVEKWRLFPAQRTETEREMAEHCRRYALEKCLKKGR